MDYASILSRYIGREVCVSTFGHIRLRGEVAAIYEDCVRLIHTAVVGESEEQWSQSASMGDDACSGENSEALVHFHHIVSISCKDDDLLDTPVAVDSAPHWLPQELAGLQAAPNEEDDVWQRFLDIDRLVLEVGPKLVGLVHPDQTDILQRVSAVRCQLADQLGLAVPPLRLRDSLQLDDQEYRVLIDENEVARGKFGPGKYLALDMGSALEQLEGIRGVDPTFGGAGIWISKERRDEAERLGYLVIDPAMLLVTHLQETLRRHSHELLSLADVRDMILRHQAKSTLELDDLRSIGVPLVVLHAVLRRLLEEGESIKNFPRILEALWLAGAKTSEVETLVAIVRGRLGRQLIQRYLDREGRVHAIGIDRELEAHLLSLVDADRGRLARPWVERLVEQLQDAVNQLEDQQQPATLIVGTDLRAKLWQMLSPELPRLGVLSFAEVPRGVEIFWEMMISGDDVGVPDTIVNRSPRSSESTYKTPGKIIEKIVDDLPARRPR